MKQRIHSIVKTVRSHPVFTIGFTGGLAGTYGLSSLLLNWDLPGEVVMFAVSIVMYGFLPELVEKISLNENGETDYLMQMLEVDEK